MSLSAKRESLARIHGRYHRAGRLHKQFTYDPLVLRPVLKVIWLSSDQLCSNGCAIPESRFLFALVSRRAIFAGK